MDNAAVSAVPGVAASARLVGLAPGLYAITVADVGAHLVEVSGVALPATHICAPDTGNAQRVEVFATTAAPGWVGPAGGTVVVKIPSIGGQVLITTYRPADQEAAPVAIQIAALGRAGADVSSAAGPAEPTISLESIPSDVSIEVTLQSEGEPATRLTEVGWIGYPGEKRRIDAFSLRPIDQFSPSDIEYKAYGPNGRETPWVSDAKLCGSRNRGVGITGFAVRLSSRVRDRYDIVYGGSFFESGRTGPLENGQACMGERRDDPLEAVIIRILSRTPR